MYRCYFCGNCSNPKEPLLRHIRTRKVPKMGFQSVKNRWGEESRVLVKTDQFRTDIAAELPVCKSCYNSLQLGITEQQLILHLRLRRSENAGGIVGQAPPVFVKKPVKVVRRDKKEAQYAKDIDESNQNSSDKANGCSEN